MHIAASISVCSSTRGVGFRETFPILTHTMCVLCCDPTYVVVDADVVNTAIHVLRAIATSLGV